MTTTTTVRDLFRENEIVHVVDETTAIWEEAKIVGFESDWSVRIAWVNWKGNAFIFKLPENLRTESSESWTIRKKVSLTPATNPNGRQIRRATQTTTIAGPYQTFTSRPWKITKCDEVSSFSAFSASYP